MCHFLNNFLNEKARVNPRTKQKPNQITKDFYWATLSCQSTQNKSLCFGLKITTLKDSAGISALHSGICTLLHTDSITSAIWYIYPFQKKNGTYTRVSYILCNSLQQKNTKGMQSSIHENNVVEENLVLANYN